MAMYIIGNRSGSYIRKDANGEFITVRKKELAQMWSQKVKARNILMNCLDKSTQAVFRVIEVSDDTLNKRKERAKRAKIKTIRDNECISDIAKKEIQLNEFSNINLDRIKNVQIDTEGRKQYLMQRMNDIDDEICDLSHYIEFTNFEKPEEYEETLKAYQNRLRQRREIKDELYIIINLGQCKIDGMMMDELKESINTYKERGYNPRKLKSLFDKTCYEYYK